MNLLEAVIGSLYSPLLLDLFRFFILVALVVVLSSFIHSENRLVINNVR